MPSEDTSGRRDDVQGLRAVAVLVVVAFHAGLPVPGGFIGVDVFFVISGFVITAMLQREWRATGRLDLRRFYLRRFKRLTPALALLVAVVMVLGVLALGPLGPQQVTAATGVGAMLLSANLVIDRTTGGYFDLPAESNALLNTWSLSVEEQFYLVFPLVLAAGWALARRSGRRVLPAYLLVGGVGAVSFAAALAGPAAVSLPGGDFLLGFYSPVTRAWEFAAGALLALAVAHRGGTPWAPGRVPATVARAAGAALLVAGLWLIDAETVFPGPWTLVPVVATVLLIAAGARPAERVPLLAAAPLVRIGDWSYSIYLWHWPFVVVAAVTWPDRGWVVVVAAALSLAPALASYRFVEEPFRRARLGRPRRAVAVVAAVVGVPVLLAGGLTVAAAQVFWIDDDTGLAAAVRTDHAMSPCSLERFDPARCRANQDAPGEPLYLVGDSTAGALTEAARGAAELTGRPLTVVIVPRCPFKDVTLAHPDLAPGEQERCREAYTSTRDWLAEQEPGLVVVAELNSAYRTDTEGAVGATPDDLRTDPDERLPVLDAGGTAAVGALRAAGHQVLLVQAAPDFGGRYLFDPTRCTVVELARHGCTSTMPRPVADAVQAVERDAVARIALETGSGVWDPRDLFCDDRVCSTERDGVSLYRDAVHISVAASTLLAPALAAAVDGT